MAKVSPWHSVKSDVHHNNTNCNTGNHIETENQKARHWWEAAVPGVQGAQLG